MDVLVIGAGVIGLTTGPVSPGVRVTRGMLAARPAGMLPPFRELVPDPTLRSVRGPKVVVENPGLDTFFMEAPRSCTTTVTAGRA